jgi:hypothetical protein
VTVSVLKKALAMLSVLSPENRMLLVIVEREFGRRRWR